MTEYIERAAVRELVKSIPHYQMFNYDRTESRRGISPDDVDFGVDKIPAADVAPVRHGRWIGIEYDGYADGFPVYDLWECSECGEEVRGDDVPSTHPWCHSCGARMGKEDDHD